MVYAFTLDKEDPPFFFKIWISASKDIKRYSQVLSATICYKAGTSKLLLC